MPSGATAYNARWLNQPARSRDIAARQGLVLAGGLGTRLRPLTDTVPKCLVPIAGRPLLDFWVDCLAEAGIVRPGSTLMLWPSVVRAHIEQVNAAGPASPGRVVRAGPLGLGRHGHRQCRLWPTAPTTS